MLQQMQQYDSISLRSFVAVVEAASFKRAAEKLETSTAAVSRRVSGLKSALGVKLLNQTTRQIDLTDAGKQFYDDLQGIFCSLDEAEERLRQGHETVKGNLRIAAPSSFGTVCKRREYAYVGYAVGGQIQLDEICEGRENTYVRYAVVGQLQCGKAHKRREHAYIGYTVITYI